MSDAVRHPALTPAEVGALTEAATAAGRAAARFFRAGATTSARIRYKQHDSPVTEADLAADAAARQVLHAAFAGVPILSEEDDRHRPLGVGRALVIDPIDGTRTFIAGRSEWCVSLALMIDGQPIAGVIHAPARGETFAAMRGQGAEMNGKALPRRPVAPPSPLTVSGPSRMVDTLSVHWPDWQTGETLKALAYRLVTVAAGTNDVAVATKGANHWDIAAADVILTESGCTLVGCDGVPPVYIGGDPLHPALIAAEAGLCARLLAAPIGL